MFQSNEQYTNSDLLSSSIQNSIISPYIKEFPQFQPKIKLGILASGNGSNLEYIIKSIKGKQLNAEISILIVNNPNCLAVTKALRYNIPYAIINHNDCSSRDEHDELVHNKLQDYSVELVVMAGWMRIAGERLINKYKDRLINIHPSLLPSFKGMDAIQQAIDNKVTITGCTVHYVQKEVDAGSIIIQAAITLQNSEMKDSIKKRIQEMEHIILPYAIAMVAVKIRTDTMGKK